MPTNRYQIDSNLYTLTFREMYNKYAKQVTTPYSFSGFYLKMIGCGSVLKSKDIIKAVTRLPRYSDECLIHSFSDYKYKEFISYTGFKRRVRTRGLKIAMKMGKPLAGKSPKISASSNTLTNLWKAI